MLAGRELTRLAGFTARVTELQDVLKDINSGRYERTMINASADSGGQNAAGHKTLPMSMLNPLTHPPPSLQAANLRRARGSWCIATA